jgi:hypothetical protein
MKEVAMKRRIGVIGSIVLGAAAVGGFAGQSAWAQGDAAATVAKADKDNDQTLDLSEVQTAAGAKFDALDADKDGSLSAAEAKGVIPAKLFAAADKDHDGSLSKDEYLALAGRLFKRADADHDGSRSAAELHSKSGRVLKRMLN